MDLLLSTAQQTLIFLPLVFGIYLSYRILAVVDLTVDGSFVLGAAVFAKLISLNINQYYSLLAGFTAGAIVGMLVALMQKIARIDSLIASILAVFMLYSINFKVMGRPNISLLDANIILANLQNSNGIILLLTIAVIIILVAGFLGLLLHSRIGLLLRAYGSNTRLLASTIGKSPLILLLSGLGISNALAALCGVLSAQINGYADINMGVGMALTAIGAVVIGQHLIGKLVKTSKFNAAIDFLSCSFGAFIYFLAMSVFLQIGIDPIFLKLVLGLVLICFLATANYSKKRRVVYEQ